MSIGRWISLWFLLLAFSAWPGLADPLPIYRLDKMWIGGSLEEFTAAGMLGDISQSKFLPGGLVFYSTTSAEAHLKGGKVRLIVGKKLQCGERELLTSSMSQDEVSTIAREQSWTKLREAVGKGDMVGVSYDVVKYRLNDDQELLFATRRKYEDKSVPPDSSFIILREATPRGPFPNL